MDVPNIFKDYINPALQKVYGWAAEHPRYTSVILLIWSLAPFLPFQILDALLIQLPKQVVTEVMNWIGYTQDEGIRPGSFAELISTLCGAGRSGTTPEGLLARLQSRLESHQSYGAVADSRTEEGREHDWDEEEDEECDCRDECFTGCCQSPTNMIKFIRLLLQTSLFFSSVIIIVISFKDGEGGVDPGKT